MPHNRFLNTNIAQAWNIIRADAREIERAQIAGERPASELASLPLVDVYDEDPDSPTYKRLRKRSTACWIVSTELAARAGVACRARLLDAAQRLFEGSHVLATEEQIIESLQQEKARAAEAAAEDLRNEQGKRPVIVSLPKAA